MHRLRDLSFNTPEMRRDHFVQQPAPSANAAGHEEKILRRLFHGYPGEFAYALGYLARQTRIVVLEAAD